MSWKRLFDRVKKGDYPGHPFRGNQYVSGKGGGGTGGSGISSVASQVLAGKKTKVGSAKAAHKLIQELHKNAQKASKDKGEAKNFDLCKVTVPGTNLFCGENKGVSRINMPQLGGIENKFVAKMKKSGIKVKDGTRKVSELKATQNQLVGKKVAGMMNDKSFNPANRRILVSKDGYIIDGHHTWATQVGRDISDGKYGDLSMKVTVIDAPIKKVLAEANKFADEMGMERKSGDVTKGDYPGHPFRGNQYTKAPSHGVASEIARDMVNNSAFSDLAPKYQRAIFRKQYEERTGKKISDKNMDRMIRAAKQEKRVKGRQRVTQEGREYDSKNREEAMQMLTDWNEQMVTDDPEFTGTFPVDQMLSGKKKDARHLPPLNTAQARQWIAERNKRLAEPAKRKAKQKEYRENRKRKLEAEAKEERRKKAQAKRHMKHWREVEGPKVAEVLADRKEKALAAARKKREKDAKRNRKN